MDGPITYATVPPPGRPLMKHSIRRPVAGYALTDRDRLPFDLVVMAASAGGLEVYSHLLSGLPKNFPVPILAVQHLTSTAQWLTAILDRRTSLEVRWANDRDRLRPGRVYVAPPAHHMTLRNRWTLTVDAGPKVNHVCPSADPLFVSAARVHRARVLALVLTGNLCDGAAGAKAVRAAGGVVLVQAPETCVATGMPRAAIANGSATFVLSPHALVWSVVSLVMVPGAVALFGARAVA